MSRRTAQFLFLACLGLLSLSNYSAPASAAIAVAPTITGPAEGSTLTSFGPTLTWTNPGGATQYHLQVTPINGDGPGVDLHIGSIATSFVVPAPPQWYGLLPDMTYTWRVRDSDATTFVSLEDASWSPWATAHFRTPAVSGSTITTLTPGQGEVISVPAPSLQWNNSRTDIFYYDVPLSKDATFNLDPATATAMVYTSLLHGGVTNPWSSYLVPASFPLEDKTDYSWRVRPHVQGDGMPAAWSSAFSFKTDFNTKPALTVQPAAFGLNQANTETCMIEGQANTFASTPILTGVVYAYKFSGAGAAVHNWYLDDKPFSVSGGRLVATNTCRTSSLGLPGGAANAGRPRLPGKYRLDVWAQGQKIQTATFSITAATAFAIGPLAVGTDITSAANCTLSGVSTAIPRTSKYLLVRYNFVGNGSLTHAIWLGSNKLAEQTAVTTVTGPADCGAFYLIAPEAGLTPGSYRWDIMSAGQVIATTNFTVS